MLYVVVIDDFRAICVTVFSVLSVGIISPLFKVLKVYGIDKVMNYMIYLIPIRDKL